MKKNACKVLFSVLVTNYCELLWQYIHCDLILVHDSDFTFTDNLIGTGRATK